MITVKAIKRSTQQSQPNREDYVEREKKTKRFVPLVILLFLTGCAAYLKSFLPTKMEAHEERHDNKHADGDEPSDLQKEDVAGAVDQEDDDANPGSHKAKSSDNVVPIRLALPQEIKDFGALVRNDQAVAHFYVDSQTTSSAILKAIASV